MKRLVAGLGIALGCAALGPAPDPLRARPYVWAAAGQVELLTCRWSGAAPIGVWLAPDASPAEEQLLDAVLRSLEGVGAGVRFLRVRGSSGASITVGFVAAPVASAEGGLARARSTTDCRLDTGGEHAALVSAAIEVARSMPDGRPLASEELAGALLHELGHALGFAGHAVGADDPLAAAPEAAVRAGRRALAGEQVESAALAALYARPSGDVLARQAVEAWRTQEVDRLARLAARSGVEGPYLRAGGEAGRIFWRDASGREWGFLVPDLAALSRDPSGLLLLPEMATRGALPRKARP